MESHGTQKESEAQAPLSFCARLQPTASALPPAPIPRAGAPTGAPPNARPDAADAHSGPEPTRSGRLGICLLYTSTCCRFHCSRRPEPLAGQPTCIDSEWSQRRMTSTETNPIARDVYKRQGGTRRATPARPGEKPLWAIQTPSLQTPAFPLILLSLIHI